MSEGQDHPAAALSRRTTPTWEMELLISGISLLALFQLSGMLSDWIEWWLRRLGQEWLAFASIMYVYAQGATLALALTFALHVVLRARWVALVGLYSVFPAGIRFDKLRLGPIQRQRTEQRLGEFPEVIERADDLATQGFAFGVGLAGAIVPPALAVVVVHLLILLADWLAGGRIPAAEALLLFMGLLLLPYLAFATLDRSLGSRLEPSGWLARTIRSGYRVYDWLGVTAASNPLLTLMSSQLGERKTGLYTSAAMVVILSLAGFGLLVDGGWMMPGSELLPKSERGAAHELRSEYYAELRGPDAASSRAPFIPAMLSRDPYLRLVIPFDPRRHPEAIQSTCATAEEPQALLRCIAMIHRLELDGVPLEVAFDFYTDTERDLRGFLAMLDVRALEPGRHELQIARAARRDAKNASADPPDRIVFWR